MVFLALLILPIVLAEYLLDLTSTQNIILSLVSWIIYSFFVAEFFAKLLVAKQKSAFIKENKFYTIISLVIILSPLLEPISELFAAAPLLRALRIVRIIRLSRLTAALAVSGRARLAWRQINYRTYAIVTSVIVFGLVISFFKPPLAIAGADQTLLSQLIQITATIYAIITGFVIANVWGKYISLIRAVNQEATSLRNTYLLAIRLENQELISNLKQTIAGYAKTVVDVYWKRANKDIALQKQTANIYASINGYYPKNPHETELYTNVIDELRKASEGQVSIKSLLAAKTPKVLWALIIVLSAVIFSGFYLTNYESQILATVTMTVMSTAVALVAVIIYDMNDPFKFGFWAVSPSAYFELKSFLKQT